MQRVHLLISGFVQGVGFRHFVRAKAWELGLVGWVKNTDNGMVEVVAEGEKEKIKKIILLCRKGPILSEVRDISVQWQEETGKFSSFEIG